LASGLDDMSAGIAIDTIDAFGHAPRPLIVILVLAIQLLAWAVPVAGVVVLLWQRRYRRGALTALAAAAAGLSAWLMESQVAARFSPPSATLPVPSWICSSLEQTLGLGAAAGTSGGVLRDPVAFLGGIPSLACTPGTGFPNVVYLAAFAAGFLVLSPWLSERWRRAAWILIGLFLVVRVMDGVTPPIDSLFFVAAAYVVGAAALLITGGPDRRPRAHDVASALRDSGLTAFGMSS
jgi:hypothetical protein